MKALSNPIGPTAQPCCHKAKQSDRQAWCAACATELGSFCDHSPDNVCKMYYDISYEDDQNYGKVTLVDGAIVAGPTCHFESDLIADCQLRGRFYCIYCGLKEAKK